MAASPATNKSDSMASLADGPKEEGVYGLLPPHEQLIDLASYGPILIAQEECERNYEGDVIVLEDEEVQANVVELLGISANLVFPCSTTMRYLVLHVKHLEKYCSVEVEVIDSLRKRRKLQASNNQSKVKVKDEICSMPLELQTGWNYLCLDLEQLLNDAFGTHFRRAICVQIFASCRVWRAFFQSDMFADAEMPPHLQVI